MDQVLNVDNDTRMAGNYYRDDYLTTNVGTGVTRNRAGTRLLALTDDFLRGLHAALAKECGPAADQVFKSCGRSFGAQFARKLDKELSDFYAKPMAEFPMTMFEACLTEAFNRHGWGKVRFDFGRHDKGLIVVDLGSAVYADLLDRSERPADALMAGVLAGLFSHFSGRALDAVQTQCTARGDAVSRFVLALADRVKAVADWPEQGKTHDEVVAALEGQRPA